MKIIANISQTYFSKDVGDRDKEIDSFIKDDNIMILNMLDVVTFSFHNCRRDFIEKSKKKISRKISRCIFFEFENMTYSETMLEYIKKLKELKVTHFLFWQDDMSVIKYNENKLFFAMIYSYYKHDNNIDYLRLFHDDITYYNDDIFNNLYLYYNFNKNNIKIYSRKTSELKHRYLIDKDNYIIYTKSFSDQPYLMSIDMCEKNVFNNNVCRKYDNVWDLERYLSYHFATSDIDIYYINVYFFNFNYLSGKSTSFFEKNLGSNKNYILSFEKKVIDYNNKLLL